MFSLLYSITGSLQPFSIPLNGWFCAYLDPGTGSYILQLMVGLFLGAAFAIKIYWRKVKAFFADLDAVDKRIQKSSRTKPKKQMRPHRTRKTPQIICENSC